MMGLLAVNVGYKIELIEQENQRFSGARNTEPDLIQGNYVVFLNSDDILLNNAIGDMLNIAYCTGFNILQGSWYDFMIKIEDTIKTHVIEDKIQLTASYFSDLHEGSKII